VPTDDACAHSRECRHHPRPQPASRAAVDVDVELTALSWLTRPFITEEQ